MPPGPGHLRPGGGGDRHLRGDTREEVWDTVCRCCAAPPTDTAVPGGRQRPARRVGADRVIALGDLPDAVLRLAWTGTGCAMESARAMVRAGADPAVGTDAVDEVAQILEEL